MTSNLVAELLQLTNSDEEMMFYFFPAYVSREAGPWGLAERKDASWSVWVKNTSSAVLLGESDPKWRTEGATLDEALSSMASLLRNERSTS